MTEPDRGPKRPPPQADCLCSYGLVGVGLPVLTSHRVMVRITYTIPAALSSAVVFPGVSLRPRINANDVPGLDE